MAQLTSNTGRVLLASGKDVKSLKTDGEKIDWIVNTVRNTAGELSTYVNNYLLA
jgi:hypothetical protein